MSGLLPAGIGALTFSIDEAGMPFLSLFAFVWTVSGAYAWVTTPRADRGRLFAYYLPSAVGGIAVALAADAISFYLCFALMAIPAWGLITHSRDAEARRAGAVYLTLTALGEAMLLAALVLMAASAGSLDLADLRASTAASPHALAIVALLLGSIGLKIGTLPASGVLPLSYAYAPAGAASALAGASAKVGMLAMLRLLPSGTVPAGWVSVVLALGLVTAFGAAFLGVLTTTPRAVLGYSSASQMGLALIAAGAGLAGAEVTPLAHGAIIAFTLHHGLAKSALVLGADVLTRVRGRARSAGHLALLVPALALAGAPLTSGFVAKYALKDAVHALHGPVPGIVYALLPFTAVGTAAVMLRFLALVRAQPSHQHTRAPAPAALWVLTLAASALAPWVWPAEWSRHAIDSALAPDALWTATWPVLAALAGWRALRLAPALMRRVDGVLTPGDVLVGLTGMLRTFDETLRGGEKRPADPRTTARRALPAILSAERRLVAWTVAGTVFVLLAIALATLATA